MKTPLQFAKNANLTLSILPEMANRHGLIAGATGTGKTITLRVLAESFSRSGVPVFLADIKGDLSGIAFAGGNTPKLAQRLTSLGLDGFAYEAAPTVFWDVFGNAGHPIRATVSELGPLLLARMLGLNDTQSSVLTLVFKIADEQGLLLLDMKDLRAMVQYAGDHAAEYKSRFGNISAASIGAIQRGLVALEDQGADKFFGEPALDLDDMLQTDEKGHGYINLLAAEKLIQSPKLYATFLLWMLSELFEKLPEAGDLDKPKFVFFFDEAHLLFADAPQPLLQKIEQVVRLIRSKGVGIYFVSQSPLDIPDAILGQLGNRVQHALRAYTPKDLKAVRAVAETFRVNPKMDVGSALTELAVGEALISTLDEQGVPSIVERAWIYPPRSRLNPLEAHERSKLMTLSPIAGHYEKFLDRESAYEILTGKQSVLDPKAKNESIDSGRENHRQHRQSSVFETFVKGAARAVGSQLGREIVRGVLGSLLGGTGTRRRR